MLGLSQAPRTPLRCARRARPCRRINPRERASLFWVTAALIAGLFAMHGMGSHGVYDSHGEPMRSSVDGTAATAAQLSPAETAALPGRGRIQHAITVPDPASSGVLGLCLTLLTGLLVLMWLRRESRRLGPVAVDPASMSRRAHPVRARDPSPLRRSQLSIWRC